MGDSGLPAPGRGGRAPARGSALVPPAPAVRRGAAFSPGPNNAVVSASVDGLVYTIEGSSTPGGPWNAQINDLGASDTPPAASGLPDLTGSAWQYHTFSAFNGIPGKGFIRAVVAKP